MGRAVWPDGYYPLELVFPRVAQLYLVGRVEPHVDRPTHDETTDFSFGGTRFIIPASNLGEPVMSIFL